MENLIDMLNLMSPGIFKAAQLERKFEGNFDFSFGSAKIREVLPNGVKWIGLLKFEGQPGTFLWEATWTTDSDVQALVLK